ncbi:hypothetical protein [Clavibacter sepedonicus]|nr:hypothetical protein [Clavibacter sepedonicus]
MGVMPAAVPVTDAVIRFPASASTGVYEMEIAPAMATPLTDQA